MAAAAGGICEGCIAFEPSTEGVAAAEAPLCGTEFGFLEPLLIALAAESAAGAGAVAAGAAISEL